MGKLCIIPARGGSKRIPRKNIKEFAGKPIISYAIEAALRSNLFDKVIVSTDDKEIMNIAINYGASIPFVRSAKTSDDYATTFDVIEETINILNESDAFYKYACCVYPTAPFVTHHALIKGFEMLSNSKGIETVLPIVKFDYPIWRALRKNSKSKYEFIWNKYENKRSQDLENAYHDAGQWYWFRVEEIMKNKRLFGINTLGLEVSSLEVHDIDTEEDWMIAEFKYAYLQRFK